MKQANSAFKQSCDGGAGHLDEAAEEQPALTHPGGLDKVELVELKVFSVHLLQAGVLILPLLLCSCEQ